VAVPRAALIAPIVLEPDSWCGAGCCCRRTGPGERLTARSANTPSRPKPARASSRWRRAYEPSWWVVAEGVPCCRLDFRRCKMTGVFGSVKVSSVERQVRQSHWAPVSVCELGGVQQVASAARTRLLQSESPTKRRPSRAAAEMLAKDELHDGLL
jgi:hypothetical protein